ncbi:MAG: peptidoglycan DD-metalloendopeptidase family protein, partial [Candidatus Binatia bacterium]
RDRVAVAAGASADVLCPWVVGAQVPGPAFLWATADVTDSAGQDDRSNDSGSKAFTVLAPDGPDLVVQRLSVRPSIARNGDTLIVKARVFNRGTAATAASVTTFRINQDATAVDDGDDVLCQAVSTPALPAGEGTRVRCVVELAGRSVGDHFVWAIADTNDTSGQVDPSNDRRRTSLTVVTSLCGGDGAPLLSWPVEEPRVIQDYASFGSVPLGSGRLGYHSGVDLLSQLPLPADQTPVYAAADGEVVGVRATCPSPADPVENPPNGRCGAGWGNYLVLRHGDGVYTTYAHLGAVFARRGCVTRGQRVAIAGSSGSTDIPAHLHFGVMSDLVEPVRRKALGNEYYRRFHPFLGRKPESATGTPMVHLDPRDFMTRSRIRITEAVVASRATVTGGESAFLGKGQRYASLGELVPGYFCIDLPSSLLPEDGPPYADDVRYGWVPSAFVEVLQTGLAPGSLRMDGLAAFVGDGVGANFIALRDEAADASAEVSKAWGGQHFAPSGNPVPDRDGGSGTWQKVDVPGTSASGSGKPREAFLPTDLVGPPPAY